MLRGYPIQSKRPMRATVKIDTIDEKRGGGNPGSNGNVPRECRTAAGVSTSDTVVRKTVRVMNGSVSTLDSHPRNLPAAASSAAPPPFCRDPRCLILWLGLSAPVVGFKLHVPSESSPAAAESVLRMPFIALRLTRTVVTATDFAAPALPVRLPCTGRQLELDSELARRSRWFQLEGAEVNKDDPAVTRTREVAAPGTLALHMPP
jgi:hypothetical protein